MKHSGGLALDTNWTGQRTATDTKTPLALIVYSAGSYLQADGLTCYEEGGQICPVAGVIKVAAKLLYTDMEAIIEDRDGPTEDAASTILPPEQLLRLQVTLVAALGPERGAEAMSEAWLWAREHPQKLAELRHPVAYLYRVGRSRTRPRLRPQPFPEPHEPDHAFEPKLATGLQTLTGPQRVAVVLVHGYGLTLREVGEITGRRIPTVQRHLERGLTKMRTHLGVEL